MPRLSYKKPEMQQLSCQEQLSIELQKCLLALSKQWHGREDVSLGKETVREANVLANKVLSTDGSDRLRYKDTVRACLVEICVETGDRCLLGNKLSMFGALTTASAVCVLSGGASLMPMGMGVAACGTTALFGGLYVDEKDQGKVMGLHNFSQDSKMFNMNGIKECLSKNSVCTELLASFKQSESISKQCL